MKKTGLKLNIKINKDHGIQSHHFMANRRGNNGNNGNDDRLFSWAPKPLLMGTAAMKLRRLPFGRKAMTNLDSVLKSKDITLLTKVHIVKAMVFSVVMYGCESWTIQKAECRRTDAFKLWYWRRESLEQHKDQTSQS